MPHCFFPGWLMGALAAGALLSPSARAGGEADAPFDYRDGLIWLRVCVDEKRELTFLFDTGAGSSLLDLACARKLGVSFTASEIVDGVNGAAQAWRTTPVQLRTGGVAIRRSMLALDLGAISRGIGRRVDGVLGADFLGGRIVQIDYAQERLRFPDRVSPDREAIRLPLRYVNDAPCVTGALGDAPARWLRIDTGCGDALQWVEVTEGRTRAVRASFGFADRSMRQRRGNFVLGPVLLTGVRAGIHGRVLFAGEGGLIGNGLLSDYTVTIDGMANEVTLSR